MKLYTILFLILSTLTILVGCNDTRKIEKEWDYTSTPITLTVYTFNTNLEMRAAVKNRTGVSHPEGLEGLAIMSGGDTVCEVFILTPNRIDDNNTLTLGHEVLHCLYGRYHPQ